ncbi:hypothetical protein [Dyadobacter sp. 3J3]|uniref:hypothetical protein n=1 Tax=Dyadobacter sp. 3J3 TaxID=2606600 RepID=UPI00135B4D94|nr:hypothetical protein [Dyadobacter sp. 3J3]
MKFILFLSAVCFTALISCQSNRKETTDNTQSAPAETKPAAMPAETKTFFVVTSWVTKNRELAMEHVPNQQKQLVKLWNQGIVENIYYNQRGKFSDGAPLPLIAFFINAADEITARATLDSTDIVRNNLAKYTLRQVGRNIFRRNENAQKLSAGTTIESYAVTWTLNGNRATMDTTGYTDQAIMTAKLQEVGILENIYVDLTPIKQKTTGAEPAVFIVNAKSEKHAHDILDAMPIVRNKKASYAMHDVGQFFMGIK